MGEATRIQWATDTFNPWVGCAKVSQACKNCYASTETIVRVKRSKGIELWGENAHRHVTSDDNWRKPLRWNREAGQTGERRRVFCASLADVFEDRWILDEPRARLWNLIHETPSLDWLLLTKRPENVLRMVSERWLDAQWPSNVWLGVSYDDKGPERVEHLVRIPAAVRFLSIEPLVADPRKIPGLHKGHCPIHDFSGGFCCDCPHDQRIDWVIVGGESGPKARPCEQMWVKSIVDQCAEARVACFVKQLGARSTFKGNRFSTAHPKGGDMKEWCTDFRVRQLPETQHT